MKNTYRNGAIIANGGFYEEAVYHVSNEKISTVFDGKGALVYYATAEGVFLNKGHFSFMVNDKPINWCMKKEVSMLGRKQEILADIGVGSLKFVQFLDKNTDCVYISYELITDVPNTKVDLLYFTDKMNAFAIYCDGDYRIIKDNYALNVTLTNNCKKKNLIFTFNKELKVDINAFDKALASCNKEIADVKVPENLSDMEKAMFYSCYFCVLENYKEKGDFKGFMAGHHYLFPMRTYYRDSYYTVLPMYNGNLEKVKNEVVTLAKGIADDGTCPSAVGADYKAFWGNHFDSPSFLAIMLYDYVRYSKDLDVMSLPVGDDTVLGKAELVMKKLEECEDDNGLIYKAGPYNRRDWVDEINRWGYVSYDEILYARALYSLSKLFALKGDNVKAENYAKKYEKTKNSINEVLWDEKLGYYVNYKNEQYVEDNLSVDTVWAVIFGIADEERSKRILKNMENLLEVCNNKEVDLPDYGVMAVYPFYQNVDAVYWTSSQPYNYHNGSNWPYWAAILAYAKRKFGMEYKHALTSWFTYNIDRNNYTPIEYFSPACKDGSLLQAWSGVGAFVLDEKTSLTFFD
ncbi:MAG: hypothetical protein E7347_04900 [Clostridiales bacterium]|nr:hypothetical protein [Clostridiales bacterium]